MQKILHQIPPLYDKNARVLILGTMPSPKSREVGFYYGHPQNRFWKVLAHLLGAPFPGTTEQRAALARQNRIALWDVLRECEINGADDASIRNPVPNDLSPILAAAPIRAVFTTGKKAWALYHKYTYPKTGIPAVVLPSPSPANCAVSFEALCSAYSVILPFLEETT